MQVNLEIKSFNEKLKFKKIIIFIKRQENWIVNHQENFVLVLLIVIKPLRI